jgi:competence protein ComEA
MFRTFLSMLALSVFVALPAQAAGATQSPAVNRPPVKPEAVIVNLNTATTKDLETLPGIGARTALRILEYRQKNGPFKKIEELMNVQGIGEKSFLKLKPQVTVETKPASVKAQSN